MKPLQLQASVLAQLVFWTAIAAVGVLSLTPVDRLPPRIFDIWDKAQHAAGFAVLALLGRLAYPPRLKKLATGLLVYGALIEFAQAATGWRQGDFNDWLADAVGTLIGVTLFRLFFLAIGKTAGNAQ